MLIYFRIKEKYQKIGEVRSTLSEDYNYSTKGRNRLKILFFTVQQ